MQIASNAIAFAKTHSNNVLIVDTAGRLAIDEAMMDEVAAIRDTIKPTETLFVVDAMTGQDAVNTAQTFNDWINFDGGSGHQNGWRHPWWCSLKYQIYHRQTYQVYFHRRKNGSPRCIPPRSYGAKGYLVWVISCRW